MKFLIVLCLCLYITNGYGKHIEKHNKNKAIIKEDNKEFLSEEWIKKEMKCLKYCLSKDYDTYDYRYLTDIQPVCTCKNLQISKKECKMLSDEEYEKKVMNAKRYYIKHKFIPLNNKYNKYFPNSLETINIKKISLKPSLNNRPNIQKIF